MHSSPAVQGRRSTQMHAACSRSRAHSSAGFSSLSSVSISRFRFAFFLLAEMVLLLLLMLLLLCCSVCCLLPLCAAHVHVHVKPGACHSVCAVDMWVRGFSVAVFHLQASFWNTEEGDSIWELTVGTCTRARNHYLNALRRSRLRRRAAGRQLEKRKTTAVLKEREERHINSETCDGTFTCLISPTYVLLACTFPCVSAFFLFFFLLVAVSSSRSSSYSSSSSSSPLV